MTTKLVFFQDNFRVVYSNESPIGEEWTITDGTNFFTVGEEPELEIDSLHRRMIEYLSESKTLGSLKYGAGMDIKKAAN